MKDDSYSRAIDELLREIPALERTLSTTGEDATRQALQRSLNHRLKRFECLIPYRFRLQLQHLCREVGVCGNFF
ncbi:MAG: hypothetical protein OHK0039_11720 [Bacteroidia bacterium]